MVVGMRTPISFDGGNGTADPRWITQAGRSISHGAGASRVPSTIPCPHSSPLVVKQELLGVDQGPEDVLKGLLLVFNARQVGDSDRQFVGLGWTGEYPQV